MSANDEIFITKQGKTYFVSHQDYATGGLIELREAETLKKAIQAAKKIQEKEEVGYGIRFGKI